MAEGPKYVVDIETPNSIDRKEVEKAEFTIGRLESCDLAVNHPLISRTHVRIETRENNIFVLDCGSANGTRVGEIKLPPNNAFKYDFGSEIVLGSDIVIKIYEKGSEPDLPIKEPLPPQQLTATRTRQESVVGNLAHKMEAQEEEQEEPSEDREKLQVVPEIEPGSFRVLEEKSLPKIPTPPRHVAVKADRESLADKVGQMIHEKVALSQDEKDEMEFYRRTAQPHRSTGQLKAVALETIEWAQMARSEIEHEIDELREQAELNLRVGIQSMKAVQKEVQFAKSEFARLEGEKEAHVEKMAGISFQIEELEKKLQATQDMKSQLDGELKTIGEKREDELAKIEMVVKNREAELSGELKVLKAEKSNLDNESKTLSEEVQQLTHKVSNYKSELQDIERKNVELEKNVKTSMALIAEKTKEVSIYEEKKTELRKEIEIDFERYKELEAELEDSEDRLHVLKKEIRDKERESTIASQRAKDELEDKLRDLKNEVGTLDSKREILSREIESFTRERDIIVTSLDERSKQLKTAGNEFETLEDKLRKGNQYAERLTEKISELSESLVKREGEVKDIGDVIEEKKSLLNEAKVQAQKIVIQSEEDAQILIDEANEQVQLLTDVAQRRHDQIIREAETKKEEELHGLKSELEDLKKKDTVRMKENKLEEEKAIVQLRARETEDIKKMRREAEAELKRKKEAEVKAVLHSLNSTIDAISKDHFSSIVAEEESQLFAKRVVEIVESSLNADYLKKAPDPHSEPIFSPKDFLKKKRDWKSIAWKLKVPIGITLCIMLYGITKTFVVNYQKENKSASDIYIQTLQKKHKAENDLDLNITSGFKSTYVNNVLYTEKFAENILDMKYQNNWVRELNRFLVEELDLHEEVVPTFIAKESAFLKDLFAIKGVMKKPTFDINMKKMREREREFKTLATKLFKNEKNYRLFKGFQKQFYNHFTSQ